MIFTVYIYLLFYSIKNAKLVSFSVEKPCPCCYNEVNKYNFVMRKGERGIENDQKFKLQN